MKCNIDAQGKAVRLRMGLAMTAVGVGLITTDRLHVVDWPWLLAAGIALLVFGVFAIYEGWAGWCVMRAMGFKTRV